MKTRCPRFLRTASALLILLFAFTLSIYSQPQYYNAMGTSNGNAFPFSVVAGKVIQWIYLPGEFSNPSPAPGGNITKIYFMCATASITYTNLTVKMGRTSLTTLPTGAFYTGQLDTVYFNPSVTLTSTAGTWMSITLNTPYRYYPDSSLVIEVDQCGATATGMSLYNTLLTGNRRTYNQTAGGCNYIYQGQGTQMANTGLDIAPISVTCSYSWANQTSGTTALLYSAKTVSNQVGWVAGATAVVRRTTDGGTTWTNANPNPGVITGDIYNIEALDANTAWVTTSPGATFIYKTTNGGTNWTQVYTLAGGFINAIKMVSATNGYAFGDPVGGNWLMLQTTDGGNTWTTLATVAGTGDGRNNCVQVSLPNMWFGTGQGTIWKSTNAGANWVSVATTGLTGQVLGVRFNNPNIGLGGGATMVKSTDGGTTYTLLTASGTGNITGIQGNGNDFWYTRGSAIFRSTDNGGTWTQVHTPTAAQNDISLVQDGNGCMTGWSCGATGTICKMTGVPVGINDPISNIPANYSLAQNYPNPFNPTTSISFALPVAGNVQLKVYDMLGKEVASLVSGSMTAGTHSVPFDASSLASGVYIYKLTAGDFTDSKKMVLIK